MSDTLGIQSHKGPYRVHFDEDAVARIAEQGATLHVIVDRRVAELHKDILAPLHRRNHDCIARTGLQPPFSTYARAQSY